MAAILAMNTFLTIVVFLITQLFVCSSVSSNSNFYTSKCPNFKAMKNVDYESYAKGVWYEAYRYPNDEETTTKCISANYSYENDVFYIEQVGVPKSSPNYTLIVGTPPETTGTANQTAVWIFKSPKKAVVFQRYILETDYNSYAIISGCRYLKAMKKYQVYAWIDTRDNIYEGKVKAAVEKYLGSTSVLNRDIFIAINNSGQTCKASSSCRFKL